MTTALFRINYHTQMGQVVAIVGDHPSFGAFNPRKARKMNWSGEGNWVLEFHFDNSSKDFHYQYVVIGDNDWSLFEQGESRVLELTKYANHCVNVNDSWRGPGDNSISAPFNSALFTKVIFGRENPQSSAAVVQQINENSVQIHFQVHAVAIPKKGTLKICGEVDQLGNWRIGDGVVLNDSEFPVWKISITVPKASLPFNYKYVSIEGNSVLWEDGVRTVHKPYYGSAKAPVEVFQNDGSFRRVFDWRGVGTAIPIFSLRSHDSCGIGEFLDLKLMVDWAHQSQMSLIQILPINDTNCRGDWRDSYPYSALSVEALHPIYIRLDRLTKDAKVLAAIKDKREKLNQLPTVEYTEILDFKMSVMRELYNKDGISLLASADFKKYLAENESWLPAYALYSVFRDIESQSNKTFNDWFSWNPKHKGFTLQQVIDLTSPKSEYRDRVGFYFYVQYVLHLQLKEAADYAASKGVGIKGDIAIGVNPKSVDTWLSPNLFRLDKQTGAPPDAFSEDGQNWGFPTYNWDEMAKDDFGWWRARLRHMAQYFHAFRIDHILGFFRIWEIPSHCIGGMMGRFYPSIPIWRHELESQGLWDINRLIDPYVKTHLLKDQFGSDWEEVKNIFFQEISSGTFRFKTEYNTERKIADFLPLYVNGHFQEKNQRWRTGLIKLSQNVILLRDEDEPLKFYPRIEMIKNASYAELGNDILKETLKRLYIDYFYHRQEGLWTTTALQRLPVMINTTKMLCCGEDLGMVPHCVEGVMDNLQILGLRIQRMSSDPKKEFMHPGEYPYMTVSTPSVHDTSTIRGWWEEDKASTQRFYNQILGEFGIAPTFCNEVVTLKIVNQHIYSKSMLTVFPVQDLFGLKPDYFYGRNPKDERINIPANPEHYWRYRMHIFLEDLIKDKDYSAQLKLIFSKSGRH